MLFGLYPLQGGILKEHTLLYLNKRQCGQNSNCQFAGQCGFQSVCYLLYNGNGMEEMTNTLSGDDEHPDGKALLANIHLAEATTAATAWVACWTEHELGTGKPQMNMQRRKMMKENIIGAAAYGSECRARTGIPSSTDMSRVLQPNTAINSLNVPLGSENQENGTSDLAWGDTSLKTQCTAPDVDSCVLIPCSGLDEKRGRSRIWPQGWASPLAPPAADTSGLISDASCTSCILVPTTHMRLFSPQWKHTMKTTQTRKAPPQPAPPASACREFTPALHTVSTLAPRRPFLQTLH